MKYIEQICIKCKGTGIVFDWSSLDMGPFALLVWFVESDYKYDSSDLTRKKCPACNGYGKIKLYSE